MKNRIFRAAVSVAAATSLACGSAGLAQAATPQTAGQVKTPQQGSSADSAALAGSVIGAIVALNLFSYGIVMARDAGLLKEPLEQLRRMGINLPL